MYFLEMETSNSAIKEPFSWVEYHVTGSIITKYMCISYKHILFEMYRLCPNCIVVYYIMDWTGPDRFVSFPGLDWTEVF